MFHASDKGAQADDDEEEEEEEEEKPEISEEEQERIARQKKLGREAKQARMRQRMRQNAVVTNFITTLKVTLGTLHIYCTPTGKHRPIFRICCLLHMLIT
jgi:FtsZ-interacting cell division protein YlmF